MKDQSLSLNWRKICSIDKRLLNDLKRRALEVLPGFLTWNSILAPIWLCFFYYGVQIVAIGILLFDFYWLLRSIFVVRGVVKTFRRFKHDTSINWRNELANVTPVDDAPSPDEVYHLCLIPTYTEPYWVLERTVKAIVDADYPNDRKIIAIITRESDFAGRENVQKLKSIYGDKICRFYHILDPLLPGIVIGKSAAMNWGGRWIAAKLDEEGFDKSKVIVTDLDADYVVHAQYFAYLTYRFVQSSDRHLVIYQPIPLFHNNVWKVPAAIRVMAATSAQWQMYLHSRPYRLVPFSSYSMSMQMVESVGFWDADVIPEDSRFYYKAFFKYGKNLRVEPVFLPLYGDAPSGKSYFDCHKSQYSQIRRWAWGATDIPYALPRFIKAKHIPIGERLQKFYFLVTNHINWAFMPAILLFGASVPAFINTEFSLTSLGQHLGFYSLIILSATSFNFLSLIYIEHNILPPKPKTWGKLKHIAIYLQFLLYPVIGLFLSAIPALEAQTRLLFGRYIEYRVTEKG
jgi:cellulose synthase/poly-beta-1,6-N-acetylglucosamine synthase-like glycosyltransferase